jgi:nucleoside-diphosphate-sugar epimerase
MSHFGGLPGLPDMTEQTVILAGASGVFGRHVTRVLTGAGYRVLGLGRGAGNDIRADLNNRDEVLRALDGRRADIVIHAATALAKPPARHRDMAATDTLRTTGMRNLVAGYHAIGASRFVTESMIFGYGYSEHGRTPLTEDDPFAPVQRDRQLEAHVAAIRTKEALTRDLGGVSLRYGLFYGPGATDGLVAMLRRRSLPAPASGGRVLPWVHLDDAATAVLAAIRDGRPGEAYNIVDDAPMGFGDHIRATAEAFGTPRPLTVPGWVLRPAGVLYALLHTDMRVSNAKARAELGWKPRYGTVTEGLAAMTAAAVTR